MQGTVLQTDEINIYKTIEPVEKPALSFNIFLITTALLAWALPAVLLHFANGHNKFR